MSPLAKEIIEKLNKEEDEPTAEEVNIFKNYKASNEEIVTLYRLLNL